MNDLLLLALALVCAGSLCVVLYAARRKREFMHLSAEAIRLRRAATELQVYRKIYLQHEDRHPVNPCNRYARDWFNHKVDTYNEQVSEFCKRLVKFNHPGAR